MNTVKDINHNLLQTQKYIDMGLIDVDLDHPPSRGAKIKRPEDFLEIEKLCQTGQNISSYREIPEAGRSQQYMRMLERMRKKCGKP